MEDHVGDMMKYYGSEQIPYGKRIILVDTMQHYFPRRIRHGFPNHIFLPLDDVP